jgi:hypothetical protein
MASQEGKSTAQKKKKNNNQEQPKTSKHKLPIFLSLFAFRLVNAYFVQTSFQPDEYFQSLEPAWDIAFGANSGAWLTWVRTLHLLPSNHKRTTITRLISDGT